MGNEVMHLRVSQLVGQLKLCLSSLHSKVQSCSAKTSGPDDTLNRLLEEGLLTLAEWDHDDKMFKLTPMAKFCKNLIQIFGAADKTALYIWYNKL